jgi:Glycyl-tRNA synthetase beta subunit
MKPAWSNALAAMPSGPFIEDLAQAVSNDGSVESAQLWLLHFASDYLGTRQSPWPAFDLFVHDFEALDRIWPVFRLAGELIPIPHRNAALAKFMVERLPQQWDRPLTVTFQAPVTVVIRLVDRIELLVSLFAAEVTLTGSKDPYALRRTAKEVLAHICLPIGRQNIDY